MNFVEPIRDRKKIAQIKNQLRGQRRYVTYCCPKETLHIRNRLFGMNRPGRSRAVSRLAAGAGGDEVAPGLLGSARQAHLA